MVTCEALFSLQKKRQCNALALSCVIRLVGKTRHQTGLTIVAVTDPVIEPCRHKTAGNPSPQIHLTFAAMEIFSMTKADGLNCQAVRFSSFPTQGLSETEIAHSIMQLVQIFAAFVDWRHILSYVPSRFFLMRFSSVLPPPTVYCDVQLPLPEWFRRRTYS